MKTTPEILGLIPARGGSKGIPRKNLAMLGGKPLLAWTILAAQASKRLARIVVTTEDEEIASVARSWGADVPFMRPADLARDDTPALGPVLHAVQWLQQHEAFRPAYILLLQPTSPFRTAQDIHGVMAPVAESGADSVVSLCEVKQHPYWTLAMREDGTLASFLGMKIGDLERRYPRRQDLPSAYAENGCLYLVQRDVLLERGSLYGDRLFGYLMPAERSLDIDTPWDLRLAEMLMRDREHHEAG